MLLTLLSWLHALAALVSRFALVRNVAFVIALRIRRVPAYRGIEPKPQVRRHRLAKPEWVRKEVLRLKALMVDAGRSRTPSTGSTRPSQ